MPILTMYLSPASIGFDLLSPQMRLTLFAMSGSGARIAQRIRSTNLGCVEKMFDRRIIGALGIASALALGAVTQASAGNGNGHGNGNNGNGNGGNQGTISAPEIDASSGIAAIALLLGALGLVAERRRRPTEVG